MKELSAKIIKDLNSKYPLEKQKKLTHEILFDITSMCNLNCTNCSVFCGLREPYFITIEEFEQQLKKMATILPLNFVSFCGGEPTLHPQFIDLCKKFFEIEPQGHLQIITNGTLLNKIADKDLEYLSKFDIIFAITLYPKLEYIKILQDFEKKCKQYNIQIDGHGIRPYFGKYDYNVSGTNDPEDFYYLCEKSKIEHSFVIFKNRIYNCCIAPDYNCIGLPKEEQDSIPLNKLNDIEQLLIFGNHSYTSCKYCTANRTIGQPLHFWHQQKDVPSEYFSSLIDLYLNNYNLYYKLQHTFGEIPECLQNDYFLNWENKEEHAICDPVSHFKKRFFDGQLDILIPFDKSGNIINMQQQLLNQKDIEKCNLYFIGINAGSQVEFSVYSTFIPLNDRIISIWYLKANSFEQALQVFYDNSFINKKLILSNYKLLYNNNLFNDTINNVNNLQLTKQQLGEYLNEK